MKNSHLLAAVGLAMFATFALAPRQCKDQPQPRSARTFDWVAQVDDSPRWSSPCVALIFGPKRAIAPTHCLATGRAYLRTGAATVHVSSAIHSLEGYDLSAIDFRDGIAPDHLRSMPLADPATELSVSSGQQKHWILLPSGRLCAATVVETASTLISATCNTFPLCYGDSGRPLIREASNGDFLVAGLLSHGDARCRSGGINRYARIDTPTAQQFLGQSN